MRIVGLVPPDEIPGTQSKHEITLRSSRVNCPQIRRKIPNKQKTLFSRASEEKPGPSWVNSSNSDFISAGKAALYEASRIAYRIVRLSDPKTTRCNRRDEKDSRDKPRMAVLFKILTSRALLQLYLAGMRREAKNGPQIEKRPANPTSVKIRTQKEIERVCHRLGFLDANAIGCSKPATRRSPYWKRTCARHQLSCSGRILRNGD